MSRSWSWGVTLLTRVINAVASSSATPRNQSSPLLSTAEALRPAITSEWRPVW